MVSKSWFVSNPPCVTVMGRPRVNKPGCELPLYSLSHSLPLACLQMRSLPPIASLFSSLSFLYLSSGTEVCLFMESKLLAYNRCLFQRILSLGPSVFLVTFCPELMVVHSPPRVLVPSVLSIQDSWQLVSHSNFRFFFFFPVSTKGLECSNHGNSVWGRNLDSIAIAGIAEYVGQ